MSLTICSSYHTSVYIGVCVYIYTYTYQVAGHCSVGCIFVQLGRQELQPRMTDIVDGIAIDVVEPQTPELRDTWIPYLNPRIEPVTSLTPPPRSPKHLAPCPEQLTTAICRQLHGHTREKGVPGVSWPDLLRTALDGLFRISLVLRTHLGMSISCMVWALFSSDGISNLFRIQTKEILVGIQ